jgi:hypothetical protein
MPFPLKDINKYVLFKLKKFVPFFPHMVVFLMVKIKIFSTMLFDQKYFKVNTKWKLILATT